MKVLMFGGAFNPPTRAHIALADFARKRMGYDKVIFVPTKEKYIEDTQRKNFAFTNEERVEMLEMISISRPWMDVSHYEINAALQPRTIETLRYLKNITKADEMKLLFGSDKLSELNPEKGIWLHVNEICHEFGIVCMVRAEDDPEKMIDSDAFVKGLKPYITLIETPEEYRNASSTMVRKKLAETQENLKQLEEMVPEELNGLKDYLK